MRFGILAHSSEGAALCFLTFCRNGFREAQHMHPDVMLDCEAMGHIMPAWDSRDHDAVRAFLAKSIQRLADGGCDFFACPDNTAHIALETPGPDLPLPETHIGDVSTSGGGLADARRGPRNPLQHGRTVYRARFRGGDRPVFPNDAEREDVPIIFDELRRRFHRRARAPLVEIFDRLKREEAVTRALSARNSCPSRRTSRRFHLSTQ